MRYLVTTSEMRNYDSNTIEKLGISACVLMERAALKAEGIIEEHCTGFPGEKYVLILAGVGNNGGDGLALARLLTEKNYQVEVWCFGDAEKASEQWKQQRAILENYPVEFTEFPKRQVYTVMVDALFGVGLSREVTGVFREAVRAFQAIEGWKLALDMPSGVDSDTGRVWGCALRVDCTITFGFCKRGLVLFPGCEYAGKVITADIGISGRSFLGTDPELFAYDENVSHLLPKRDRSGNKGTFGKVLLVAGSENMAGAAVLAARAAYRAGAGMVKVITPKCNRIILQQAVSEALIGRMESLEEGMEWADVIAIGPGLGKKRTAQVCLERVIQGSTKPLVVDADGLNLLSENPKLQDLLREQGERGRAIVLTPHMGELARLMGKSVDECKENPTGSARELAASLHTVVVAKDARTFICGEGCRMCVNLTGNSGMATAGSGDVLTGIVAALLAQGMEAFEAAAVGVYVHGLAGDAAAAERGEHAVMAGDIAEHLSRVCAAVGAKYY